MKAKTINISLPEQLLEEIDRKAREEYRSRSELIKEATLYYIQTRDNWQVLQGDISRKANAMGVKTEDDIEELIDSTRL